MQSPTPRTRRAVQSGATRNAAAVYDASDADAVSDILPETSNISFT